MSGAGVARHALVLGASGLVGRHLIMRLLDSGARVTAAVRSEASGERMLAWLREHGVTKPVGTALVDFTASPILAGGPAEWADVTEIHNCAGSFRFGMTAAEARGANVGIVEQLVAFAAELPLVQRVVHISGYRVGGQDPALVPWSDEYRAATYRELGAYEASKVESDAVFQANANAAGVPWTIVNPATVIGDSVTGESEQLVGFASTIQQLWDGTATALPSNADIFLPVVTVDFLAAFMVAAAVDTDAVGRAYWVLDTETPPLTELLTRVGQHLGVKVPRLRIPVGLIKRLPARISGVDPETLGFMSNDRYPTGPAVALAQRHGLRMPDVHTSLMRWVDYLALHRFGTAAPGARRFVSAGGLRTLELGDPAAPRVVLPGLPVNAETWVGVAADTGARVRDLPGLGLSGGAGIEDWDAWLPAVLDEDPVELIGHSIGAAAAVTAAARFPDRVSALTLVAPFFLQRLPGFGVRMRTMVREFLRHASPAQLSRTLTGFPDSAGALDSVRSDLSARTAGRVAAQLARTHSRRWRAELRDALASYPGPVRIITGSNDPLDPIAAAWAESLPGVTLHSLRGAGHHPQLTHRAALSAAIEAPVRELRSKAE